MSDRGRTGTGTARKMAEIAATAKEEEAENMLVRIAQMEAAEKDAMKESQVTSEELEKDIQEEFHEEFLEYRNGSRKDRFL